MPFESEAQRRYAYATHQPWAAEFEAATPKGMKLPERKHPKPAKRSKRKIVLVKPHVRRGARKGRKKVAQKAMPKKMPHGSRLGPLTKRMKPMPGKAMGQKRALDRMRGGY